MRATRFRFISPMGMRSVRHAESDIGLSVKGPLSANTLAITRRHAWARNFYS